MVNKYLCKFCGKIITFASSYKRYYCSEKCWTDAHTKVCVKCGVTFVSSTKTTRLFCDNCDPMNVDHTHDLYQVYIDMIYRCYNPNRINYSHYGDRNIKVCQRWFDFRLFCKDMGIRPSGFTLDRIDNSKGYYKSNCRWLNKFEQRVNRRRFYSTTREFKGVSKNHNRFVATIRYMNKSYYLGSFKTANEAAIAYNKKLKEFYPDSWECYKNEVSND